MMLIIYIFKHDFSGTLDQEILFKNMKDIWEQLTVSPLLMKIDDLSLHLTIKVYVFGNGKIYNIILYF